MDPVTHAIIGMAVSKVAGNEVAISDAVTMATVVGAVFPDIDILFQKWGDYVYLKNHRGMTHSVFGLVASSLLITIVIGGVYHSSNFWAVFFGALMGCCSHTFFDLFNSYGAKVLWPFSHKKFSLSLLIIFDPIFVGTLVGYIFTQGIMQSIFLVVFFIYLSSRVIMRNYTCSQLKKEFCTIYEKVSLLPSMTGLFRWHFILEGKEFHLIGERNLLKRSTSIIQKLNKIHDEAIKRAMISPVGMFFKEFTPLFHVASEKVGGITRYIFTDMRYYMRNNFLHHAILEVDESDTIVKSSFNPYSIHRSVEM